MRRSRFHLLAGIFVLAAGACRAEVYLSTDAGETWAARGPKDFDVTQLVPDPKNPAAAWAIAMPTKAKPGEDLRFASPAVLHTGDSGKTWDAIGSYKGSDPICLAVDPANADVVYVGATFGWIQKSKDRGKTWMPLNFSESCRKLDGTPARPGDNVHVVCVRGDRVLAAGNFAHDSGFVVLSADAGKTWTLIRDDYQTACALAGDRILAVNRFGKAVSSTDNGRTWNTFREMRGMEPQYGNCYGAFATSPDGHEVVFSCCGDTNSSVDGGDWKSWPTIVEDAYAANVAWCGTRMLAMLKHGQRHTSGNLAWFHESSSCSLRVRNTSDEWISLPTPDDRNPVSLANTFDGSAVWLVAK